MHSWPETIRFFGLLFTELIVLFTVITFLVSLLNRKVGPERIKKWMSGGDFTAPAKGALIGMITPFCSCSTIPMLLGMLKAGTRFSGAAAFLLISPLVNPIILTLVFVLMGWKLMLGYAVVVVGSAILLAIAWEKLGLERHVRKVKVAGGPEDEGPWGGIRVESRVAARDTVLTVKKLFLPLLIGISIGAVIHGAVPQSLLATFGNAVWAVPAAAIIGIPLYIRGSAALPIGMTLISGGVGIGPVFALVIGGTGASIPEVSMLSGIFKPALVGMFLASVMTVAVAGGFLLPLFA